MNEVAQISETPKALIADDSCARGDEGTDFGDSELGSTQLSAYSLRNQDRHAWRAAADREIRSDILVVESRPKEPSIVGDQR